MRKASAGSGIVLIVTAAILVVMLNVQGSFALAGSGPGSSSESINGAGAVSNAESANGAGTGQAVQGKQVNRSFRKTVPVVRAAAVKDYNHITWDKVAGAKYYNVYRSTSARGRYKLLKKVKGCHYNDKKSESGRVYYYKVRAYKKSRVKTRLSAAARVRTVYRVYIACGHGTKADGTWDPGCKYQGLQEARLMLPITRDFVKYMRQSGVYVYTDADNGNKMNIIKGIRFANTRSLSAYISVHCDWEHARTGTYPLYKSAADRKLAAALNSSVTRSVGIATRGLCRRTDLRELNKTNAVSCIFETGSIKYDNKLFTEQHDAYGKALARGLCNYLGVDPSGF